MKKSDLKTGMLFKAYNSDEWLVCVNEFISDKRFMYFDYSDGYFGIIDDIPGKLECVARAGTLGNLMNGFKNDIPVEELKEFYIIWQRKPEKTFELDGVEYSESTLRSLIKKAVDSEAKVSNIDGEKGIVYMDTSE